MLSMGLELMTSAEIKTGAELKSLTIDSATQASLNIKHFNEIYYILYLILSLRNPVCIYAYNTSEFRRAIFHVASGFKWIPYQTTQVRDLGSQGIKFKLHLYTFLSLQKV